MSSINLQGLVKRYGETTAVAGIDLEIETGELFFLLGPSGCGKTTLLRMIAGFIEPNAGRIMFGDRDVTDIPPNRRNTGMVFQSYALWPHMTVAENVAYGLSVRKVRRKERRTRVSAALDAVQMTPYASRKPNELSGGQQQRVALARALVVEPTVLLLDEPLSNLDAKLRLEMRTEIRRICRQTRITTVYVTHDQKEALSMADRVAVLRDGLVSQLGTPRDLYRRPNSRFVAEFLGETNVMSATVEGQAGGRTQVMTAAGRLESSIEGTWTAGQSVLVSLRPEALRIVDGGSGLGAGEQASTGNGASGSLATNVLSGPPLDDIYLGEMAQYLVGLGDGAPPLKTLELNPPPFVRRDDRLQLTVDPSDVVLLPVDS